MDLGSTPTISTLLPGIFTVDTLPDPAASPDMYARVTDLFGSKRDLVLASSVNGTAFWQPVRPLFAQKQTIAADATLYALKMPSVILMDGSLPGVGLFRTLTLSPTLAFPGASFRLRNRMGGLGTLRVANVNLGTPVSILASASQEFIYDMVDGWIQVT